MDSRYYMSLVSDCLKSLVEEPGVQVSLPEGLSDIFVTDCCKAAEVLRAAISNPSESSMNL